jgi:hypothetical protein
MSEKPYEIVVLGTVGASGKEFAATSLLHSLLNHMAEVQLQMLEAISKKFGHSLEDLVECIRDTPELMNELNKGPGVKEFVEVKYEMKTKSGKKVLIKKS